MFWQWNIVDIVTTSCFVVIFINQAAGRNLNFESLICYSLSQFTDSRREISMMSGEMIERDKTFPEGRDEKLFGYLSQLLERFVIQMSYAIVGPLAEISVYMYNQSCQYFYTYILYLSSFFLDTPHCICLYYFLRLYIIKMKIKKFYQFYYNILNQFSVNFILCFLMQLI